MLLGETFWHPAADPHDGAAIFIARLAGGLADRSGALVPQNLQ